MKALAFSIALLAGAGLAAAASAQPPGGPPPGPQPPNLIDMPGNTGKAKLTVTSAEVKTDVLIPNDNSSFGKSLSPQVTWTKGPASTKSYVVAMEDSDAQARGAPITHWVAFNIPASTTSLPGGLPPQGTATPPAGFTVGNNIRGQAAYMGPGTPPKATHHYHLEVLALDTTLPLMAGASRADIATAIQGHVVGTGEVVGLFTGPDRPPAPAGGPPPAAK
ncbi:MAG: YbhB/YbcL family Raf kinase inhibitor-like protein [Caulobacteraceae bacterium]